ncbi:MAG TPA: hypothetical protein VH969_16070 [Actinophytocola sp.]|jgi:hypothetical protein|uniref:hypothetical protein n=1 Tax=Actinophytocola sp. TaxID=1872138 RepID=UPI002F92AD5C
MNDWDTDEGLSADLAEALRARAAVPDRFVRLGKEAFAWHTVDAELAALTIAEPEMAGSRAEGAVLRALTFVASRLTIELEVTDTALVGQIVPPQPGELTLRRRDGSTRAVSVDAVGWFHLRPRPTGRFQLHLRTADGMSVVTEWTEL